MKKKIKSIFALMLVSIMLTSLFQDYKIDAENLAIPKISVKTIKGSTGFTITIGKTKGAEGYEMYIAGTPENSKYCDSFKRKDYYDDSYTMGGSFTEYIYQDGKKKRSVTHKDLPAGTYTVKVRSWKENTDGTRNNSDWTKEKSFTLKEAPVTGYETSYDFSKTKKGDIVKFGAYEQDLDFTNGKEAIEWIVLKKTKKSVLLLSKYALEMLPYNISSEKVTWRTCTLREWLNKIFFKNSFNETEKEMIKETTIKNADNSIYMTPGGLNTKDKVFLLSESDMINPKYGFSEDYKTEDIVRRCAFAWNKGIATYYSTTDNVTASSWWLRSPGRHADMGGRVTEKGNLACDGSSVNWYSGVRPAIYISLK